MNSYDRYFSHLMEKKTQWLSWKTENDCLSTALKNATKNVVVSCNYSIEVIYFCIENFDALYSFVGILNGIGEAVWSGCEKIIFVMDSPNEQNYSNLKRKVHVLVKKFMKLFEQEISIEFYMAENLMKDAKFYLIYDDLLLAGNKYKRACDIQRESKILAIMQFFHADKLFFIFKGIKPGRMLKRSGIALVTPFYTKTQYGFAKCPEQAKIPPAGYCLRGVLYLIVKHRGEYTCRCNEDDELYNSLYEIWKMFDENHDTFEQYTSFSHKEIKIIDFSQEKSNNAILLFGAPSVDLANYLLFVISKYYNRENRKIKILIEDIMPKYLYRRHNDVNNQTQKIFQNMNCENVQILLHSEMQNIAQNVDWWLNKLTIKDLLKIRNAGKENACFPLNGYDAIHLAVMASLYEQCVEDTVIIHSYNETAIHIFSGILNNKNYISCHGLDGCGIRFYNNIHKEYRAGKKKEMERIIEDKQVIFMTSDRKVIKKETLISLIDKTMK